MLSPCSSGTLSIMSASVSTDRLPKFDIRRIGIAFRTWNFALFACLDLGRQGRWLILVLDFLLQPETARKIGSA